MVKRLLNYACFAILFPSRLVCGDAPTWMQDTVALGIPAGAKAQSMLIRHPNSTAGVSLKRPDLVAVQTLPGGPLFPNAIAQPLPNAVTEQAEPNHALAILDD